MLYFTLQTVPAITSSSKCPRLETTAGDTDVVVHSGQYKKIAVRVTDLLVRLEN
jgi:hypothetical protein